MLVGDDATLLAGLMAMLSGFLTGLVVGVSVVILLVMVPFAKQLGELSKQYQDALGHAQTASTEALSSMRTVRAFVAEELEEGRYKERIGDPTATRCWCPKNSQKGTTIHVGIQRVILGSLAIAVFMGLFFGLNHVVSWLGFTQIINGEMSLGDLVAFNSYIIGGVGVALGQLVSNVVKLIQAKGAAQRVFELLERATEINLRGGASPEAIHGEVVFEQVSFSYPTRPDVQVLENFSLRVPPNSTAALVGASGSGKSTVISLLQRFYNVDSGRVLVDGHDIQDLDPGWLRSRIGFVQQEPTLFGMTIRDNVTYGLTRTVTDTEVEQACCQASAHDFVVDFPEKYHTLVGERGVRLSGGQKQRLAIARALLVDPRILLLDEATSALDAESEQMVQVAINRLMLGRTTIVVAHRLSTVRDAQQIVVVDERRILDVGRHDELMQRCERYQELVKRQVNKAPDPPKLARFTTL